MSKRLLQLKIHHLKLPFRGKFSHAAAERGGTDTIVEYKSSHLAGAESELIIEGVHTCTDHPQAIREVRRILLLHADESGIEPGGER